MVESTDQTASFKLTVKWCGPGSSKREVFYDEECTPLQAEAVHLLAEWMDAPRDHDAHGEWCDAKKNRARLELMKAAHTFLDAVEQFKKDMNHG